MKLYTDIKFIYQNQLYMSIVFVVTLFKIMFLGVVALFKEFSLLIQDIIDPDINYDSIEDLVE